MENYEVKDPEVESTLRSISSKIRAGLKLGWGFLLMLFEFGPKGANFYASNADRDDTIKMLQEWLQKQGALPLRDEINPTYSMTNRMRDQWHKLTALLMVKSGVEEVRFKADDIKRLGQRNMAAAVDVVDDEVRIRLVTMAQAKVLAEQEGKIIVDQDQEGGGR